MLNNSVGIPKAHSKQAEGIGLWSREVSKNMLKERSGVSEGLQAGVKKAG